MSGAMMTVEEARGLRHAIGTDAYMVARHIPVENNVAGAGQSKRFARCIRQFRTGEPALADEYDACIEQRGLAGWESKLPPTCWCSARNWHVSYQ